MEINAGTRAPGPDHRPPKPLNDELVAELERIYQLLIDRGADLDAVNPLSGQTLLKHYGNEPLGRFLRRG